MPGICFGHQLQKGEWDVSRDPLVPSVWSTAFVADGGIPSRPLGRRKPVAGEQLQLGLEGSAFAATCCAFQPMSGSHGTRVCLVPLIEEGEGAALTRNKASSQFSPGSFSACMLHVPRAPSLADLRAIGHV